MLLRFTSDHYDIMSRLFFTLEVVVHVAICCFHLANTILLFVLQGRQFYIMPIVSNIHSVATCTLSLLQLC